MYSNEISGRLFGPFPSSQFAEDPVSIQKETRRQELNIPELYQARDKLREFGSLIKDHKLSPLRQDVLEHCERIKISKTQSLNLQKVEKMTRNRIQKMIKNKRIKRNWSQEDVLILIWIISKYADWRKFLNIDKEISQKDWTYIAELIPGVDGESCMFKWLSLKKYRLSDHSWSQKQSNLLHRIVRKTQDQDWGFISQQLYYLHQSYNKVFRCPKQCRQHWNCYLNPNLKKGPWSHEQDIALLSEIRKRSGCKKWAQMVKFFDGRTENALKNRFNLLIEKEKSLDPYHRENQMDLICSFLERNQVSQYVSQRKEKIFGVQSFNEIKCQFNELLQPHNRILRKRQQVDKQAETSQNFRQRYLYQIPIISQYNYHVPERYEQALIQHSQHDIMTPIRSPAFQDFGQQFEASPFNIPLSFDSDAQKQSMSAGDQNFDHEEFMSPRIRKKDSESLPDLQKIQVIPVKSQSLSIMKQLISLSQIHSFVPCKIFEDKLIKLNYE